MVSQIVNAVQKHKDDAFQIDNQELNQITIVGTIKSVQKLSTNLTLVIADATGEVDVRQWLDGDDPSSDMWKQGMVVRVIGHLREFQEKRSVLAFKIRPVHDVNEVTYHQLMATHVHLFNKFGPLPETKENAGGATNAYVQQTSAAAPQNQTDIQTKVLNFIRGVNGSEGASIDEIKANFRNMVSSEQAITDAIEYLSSEGHVYSTFDDQHFKASSFL